jgi:hypothetical protein
MVNAVARRTYKKVRRWLVRSDGVRQHYNITSRTLQKHGYLYNRSARAYKRAITGTAAPTTAQILSTSTRLKVEDKIRDAVFHSIDRVNRKLANMVPVAYDEKEDIWIVNDYQGKHPIPIEIKIKYHNDSGKFYVSDYAFRGDSSPKVARALQRELNS